MDKKKKKPQQDERTVKEMFTSRAFRAGSFSVLISLIAIAAVVILNIIVSKLPASATKYDMTPNSILTLEEQTLQILDNLQEDVTVYMICEEGSEDDYTKSLLEQYAAKSSHLKIDTRDPVLYPNFASQYAAGGDVSKNSLVVLSDKRGKYVDYDEIYLTTYDTEGNVEDISFDGEGAITSAIDYVVSDNLPVVYTLAGHGEKELTDSLKGMIQQDNMELKSLNLGTAGGVPEDADCLILADPATDISEEEAAMLKAYMEAGGNLLLVTSFVSGNLENVYSLTEYYGVETVPGVVIEGDGDHYYSYSGSDSGTAAFFLVPDLADVEITSALRAGGYRPIVPLAMGLQETELHRGTITVTPVLTTSNKAFAKQNFNDRTTSEKEEGDLEGPFSVAVLATEAYDDVETNLFWISSSAFLDAEPNVMSSGANENLLMGALGYMTGDVNSISIHNSSTLFYDRLIVTQSDARMWSILFIGIIPVMLLAAGGVILYRRRKH